MQENNFIESLDLNYDIYKLNMLNSSRINIFKKSEEIYHKYKIYKSIRESSESISDEAKHIIIFVVEDVIDNVYEWIHDRNLDYTDNNIINALNEIISSIDLKSVEEELD